MTDQPAPTPADVAPSAAAAGEDRVLPGLVYVLYLVGLANGVTILLGLILAYLMRDQAGPKAQTHYTFMIRSFWMSIGWFMIGALLALFGGILSIILIGIPALMLGIFIMGAVGVWFAVRCILGLLYLSRDEAYPRPTTWLV